jgi:hypothetical protein
MSDRRKGIKQLGILTGGSLLFKSPGIVANSYPGSRPPELKNPLIDTPGMSDPHALVEDGYCYLYTGHDVGHGVADWVMPDWRIFRSRDFLSWEHVGTIRPEDNYMGKGNTSCWAGDIAKRNGKYYWYFSNRKLSSGVMVATKPEGPFEDALGKPLVDSFDPSIFMDDDQTPYIVYGEHTYKIARLKESMIELDEAPLDQIIVVLVYSDGLEQPIKCQNKRIFPRRCLLTFRDGFHRCTPEFDGPLKD